MTTFQRCNHLSLQYHGTHRQHTLPVLICQHRLIVIILLQFSLYHLIISLLLKLISSLFNLTFLFSQTLY